MKFKTDEGLSSALQLVDIIPINTVSDKPIALNSSKTVSDKPTSLTSSKTVADQPLDHIPANEENSEALNAKRARKAARKLAKQSKAVVLNDDNIISERKLLS